MATSANFTSNTCKSFSVCLACSGNHGLSVHNALWSYMKTEKGRAVQPREKILIKAIQTKRAAFAPLIWTRKRAKLSSSRTKYENIPPSLWSTPWVCVITGMFVYITCCYKTLKCWLLRSLQTQVGLYVSRNKTYPSFNYF